MSIIIMYCKIKKQKIVDNYKIHYLIDMYILLDRLNE